MNPRFEPITDTDGSITEIIISYPDNFVEHGTRIELLHDLGIHPDNLISILKNENVKELNEY